MLLRDDILDDPDAAWPPQDAWKKLQDAGAECLRGRGKAAANYIWHPSKPRLWHLRAT